MQHKMNTRPRHVDFGKQLPLIRDLKALRNSGDSAKIQEANEIESKFKELFQFYDNKKTIIVPKTHEKQSDKQSNTQPSKNNSKSGGVKIESNSDYSVKKFIRPESYIIYSEKSRADNHKREYELTHYDFNNLELKEKLEKDPERKYATQFESFISSLEYELKPKETINEDEVKNIANKIIKEKYPLLREDIDKLCRVRNI